MGDWQEGSWTWHLIWRRALYDWEIEDISNLKGHIEQKKPSRDLKDGVVWRHTGNLSYPVKSITATLCEQSTPTLPKAISYVVWQKFIPPRAQLYVWLANLEKLNTGDFLVEKGIIEAQRALCPLCNLQTESNSHVLFSCTISWRVWMNMLEWWGISGALQNQCRRFCLEWLGLVKNRKYRKLWGLIQGCVIWSLWYQRNKIKFENGDPNANNFIYSLKIRIGIWAKEMMGFPGWSSDDVTYNINSLLFLM